MNQLLPNLDSLLHQPARTQLMAYLSSKSSASFSELKRVLVITDGNLGAHLSKLQEAGYINQSDLERSNSRTGRSQTLYQLTSEGQQAFMNYITQLTALLSLESTQNVSEPNFYSSTHWKNA